MFGSDTFGRLLYLSVRKNIDLSIAFKYPLLPVPPCFAHSDESLFESKKSSVIHLLKEKIDYCHCRWDVCCKIITPRKE